VHEKEARTLLSRLDKAPRDKAQARQA
jgi:hypothetical protein